MFVALFSSPQRHRVSRGNAERGKLEITPGPKANASGYKTNHHLSEASASIYFFDDVCGQVRICQLEVVKETLEPFVDRLCIGASGKSSRQN